MSGRAHVPRVSTTLVSYGGVHRSRAEVRSPVTETELAALFARATREGRRVNLRGAGLAFDDQALGDDLALSLERFDSIAVDAAAGTVTAGGGATWGAICRAVVEHDLFPAVVISGSGPTVGGTLAANSYARFTGALGKESHWVEAFNLLAPTGERLRCSRKENRDVFETVIGGHGGIGAVLSATYRLIPLNGARQVRTELRKTYSRAELIHGILAAKPQGTEAVSTVLVPGTGRAFLFRSRYVCGQAPDPLPGMAANTWWRLPLEWAGRPAVVSQPFWRLVFAKIYKEQRGYVDDLFGYTFFMDSNTRAKRIARRFGFPMRLVQQTHFIPSDPPGKAIDFLELIERTIAQYRVSPVFYDVLLTPDDPDSLLSSSRGRPGFLVSAAFEPLSRASLLRTEACCRELAHRCLEFGGRIHLSKNVQATTDDLEQMYGPELDRYFAIKRRTDPRGLLTNRFFERLFPARMAAARA